jgi:23S rRNA pseudouridine2605 synthase
MEERLQKIIAQAGLASRRGAEKMILEGRVKVNRTVVAQLGRKADPEKDLIEVDGRKIKPSQTYYYYIFNKPAGYLVTMKDTLNRPTISKFLTHLKHRVFPVGRLDMDTEGLLLLTNDGELSARLMHPRYHVPKTYRVKVKGRPSEMALAKLAGGILVLGDTPVKPAVVEVIKQGEDRTWLSVTLTEGRHRQVKRMCSQVGHPVLKLKRTHFGPLKLGRLPTGALRPLTAPEIKALKAEEAIQQKREPTEKERSRTKQST